MWTGALASGRCHAYRVHRMETWVGAIAALAGVVVGAGIALLIDWERRTQEDRRRVATEKRALYVAFLGAADRSALHARERVCDLSEVFLGRRQRSEVRNVRSLDDVSRAYDLLAIPAPRVVDEAAQHMLYIVGALQEHGHEVGTVDPYNDAFRRAIASYSQARAEFRAAARRDLGVDEGDTRRP